MRMLTLAVALSVLPVPSPPASAPTEADGASARLADQPPPRLRRSAEASAKAEAAEPRRRQPPRLRSHDNSPSYGEARQRADGATAAAPGPDLTAAAAQYSVRRTPDAIRLEDGKSQIVVSIAPSAGNVVFEMQVKGRNVLQFPSASLEEFKARPSLAGIPFLAPWANRLDEQAFYANGKKYAFDMELGNVRGAHPIHGFLSAASQWQIVEANADRGSAWVTSRLEFYRQPAWIAQFPFAHTIEMTHRLQDGALEITTGLHNLSAEPMPVAIGFHPYFRLSDSVRDEWIISLGARTEWVLAPDKIPTGETRPIEQRFPNPGAARLRDHDLDHVFGDLIRDASGRAVMSVQGPSQKLDVVFGPNYRAAVVYAPKGRDFICFEPMAGITDALNLAQRGLYKELQHVPAGGTWRESFWVRPSGF